MSLPAVMAVEILSPDGPVASDSSVLSLQAVTTTGEITILPGHEPIFTRIAAGELSLLSGAGLSSFAVAGGFIEVFNGRVTVLADFAIRSEEILEQDVQSARAAALEAMNRKPEGERARSLTRDLQRYDAELIVLRRTRRRRASSGGAETL